jgi:cytochrome c biogenesis protein CcdA
MMAPFLAGPYDQKPPDIKVLIGVIVVAVALAAMSTVWPPSQYIFISSAYLFVPGKSAEIFIMLLIYNFILVVPMLGVYLFVESDFFSRWVQQSPSMVKMIFSALLIALGGGLVYIFW